MSTSLVANFMLFVSILWSCRGCVGMCGCFSVFITVVWQLLDQWTGGGGNSHALTCMCGRSSFCRQEDRKGSKSTDGACDVTWRNGFSFTYQFFLLHYIWQWLKSHLGHTEINWEPKRITFSSVNTHHVSNTFWICLYIMQRSLLWPYWP